ncbi:MAG: bifunctional (p)ppGpp synthetase/guanosine-3',5'-bis(diphosphate) 3'-pyrophosphohydrolase [bacterium]|nr:bifunctional (p)ppGpp synthetase/guanosine-3',5'-bis(diphosphate) 3'-pyrophosphohydrolase [bacterium]MDT8366131.1 bifunctional (p)ppGpp synthetase/guanosine-3',5'-bis(diphosphate) 3'-pyrophosphohydrolase [bacterium]
MIRLDDIIEKVREYNPKADFELINRAYVYSAKAHAGHVRQSGEPYLIHPLQVAGILSDMKMDVTTIAVGLLHDTVEDTEVTREDLLKLFGDEVAFLVEGLTKISRLDFETRVHQQAENLRRMILSMAQDIRVIMVKLADRLHNMRTLEHLRPEKRIKIAQETMDIYAPLANRLGISWMQSELEDLSFKYLYPEAYENLEQKVEERSNEYDTYIRKVILILSKVLDDHDIKGEVTGRVKHLWSTFNKMQRQGLPFDQIYDLIAFRIVVDSVRDCYGVLGLIHSMFKPVPGRFKDYIGVPKSNRYQSLHTTVIGPVGERMEVQIRSGEMHHTAEDGIASHWRYKSEDHTLPEEDIKRFKWFKQILEELSEVEDPRELMETVRTDLFPDEVYVFTPTGDVKEFPAGATPIDFAYSIHTDVGNQCVGARINGRMVPLKYKLKNGDVAEIITSKGHKPSKDWLKLAGTNSAKSKIRSFIKREERERSLKIGEELLDKELRKMGTTLKKMRKTEQMAKTATAFGFHKVEDLIATVGFGKYSPRQVLGRLFPEEEVADKLGQVAEVKALVRKAKAKARKEGIVVDGLDDLMVRFALCCNPLPGDEVVGIITRGRGISVHTADCPNIEAERYDSDRVVEINWDDKAKVPRKVSIKITSEDIKGILAEMTGIISERNINITHADIRTSADDRAINTFDVEVEDVSQLKALISRLTGVKGVISVERIKAQ